MMVAHSELVIPGKWASPLGNGRYLLVWRNCRPTLPDCADQTSAYLLVMAYAVAVVRGHDGDQPRNLAKSVTVE
jgi:hypothetical protein